MGFEYLAARVALDRLIPIVADQGFSEEFRRRSLGVLQHAQPIYVSPEISTVLIGAMATFRGAIYNRTDAVVLRVEDIPFQQGFTLFQRPVLGFEEMWWEVVPHGVNLHFVGEGTIGIAPWKFETHVWETKWRDKYSSPIGVDALMVAWSLWTFMAQKIVTVARHSLPRQMRKRVPLEVAERGVSVIQLRRRVPANGEKDGNGSGPSVRFSVRGHWRNQWYPSEHRHKPKFISAYIKGPDDAPLRLRSPIVAVTR